MRDEGVPAVVDGARRDPLGAQRLASLEDPPAHGGTLEPKTVAMPQHAAYEPVGRLCARPSRSCRQRARSANVPASHQSGTIRGLLALGDARTRRCGLGPTTTTFWTWRSAISVT